MAEEHKRFKLMLKDLDLNYYDIAEITGLGYDSVKNQMAPTKNLPKWAKSMLYVYERMKGQK